MREFVATLLALVLPSPEREKYERETPLDVPFWSLLLGFAMIASCAVYLVDDYFKTLPLLGEMTFGEGDGKAAALAVGGGTTDQRIAYNLSGALTVITWWLQPHVILGFLVAIAGGARVVAYLAARQSLGDPWVYVAVRLGQALQRKNEAQRLEQSLGPLRPDRFLPAEGKDQWLLSARSRPDWQVGFSVDLAGEIYRIAAIELKPPAGERGNVYHYHLREQPEGQMIRRLVAYQPR